jgi:hypothetical protein
VDEPVLVETPDHGANLVEDAQFLFLGNFI